MEIGEMYTAIMDKLVCTEIEIESEQEFIIIRPESTAKPQVFLKVMSVGDDVKNVKVGDIVAVHNRAGMAMMGVNDEVIRIIKEDEIFCIVNVAA